MCFYCQTVRLFQCLHFPRSSLPIPLSTDVYNCCTPFQSTEDINCPNAPAEGYFYFLPSPSGRSRSLAWVVRKIRPGVCRHWPFARVALLSPEPYFHVRQLHAAVGVRISMIEIERFKCGSHWALESVMDIRK